MSFEVSENILFIHRDISGNVVAAHAPGMFSVQLPSAIVVCDNDDAVVETVRLWDEKCGRGQVAIEAFKKGLPTGAKWRGGAPVGGVVAPKPKLVLGG